MFILYTVVFQSVQMMTKLKSAGINKVKNWINETDRIRSLKFNFYHMQSKYS